MSAAMTRRKIVMATWTPCTVVSRSSLMSLIITFMFEPAKLQMNCASASGTSTARRFAAGCGAASTSATGAGELAVDVDGGADEGEVGERLREVPHLVPRRVD